MIVRRLFEPVSCTYSCRIGSRRGGEALIIDPVFEKVDRYLQLVREQDLHLVKAVDTQSARRSHHRPWRPARPHAADHSDGGTEQSGCGVDARRRRRHCAD